MGKGCDFLRQQALSQEWKGPFDARTFIPGHVTFVKSSRDTESVRQHVAAFLHQNTYNLGRERSLHGANSICETPPENTAPTASNSSVSPRSRARRGGPSSARVSDSGQEASGLATRQPDKSIQIGREAKPLLSTGDMILYTGNPEESTPKATGAATAGRQVTGPRVRAHGLFLFPSSGQNSLRREG